MLTVEADVSDRSLNRFTEPSGGGDYVRAYCYPTGAPDLFCCFDQLDLPAPLSLSLRVPAGWSCVANGAVAGRPVPGSEGTWQFAPARLKPLEFIFCAGPLRTVAPRPTATLPPPAEEVALSEWTEAGWTSFAYDEKPRALRADELPTTEPVSSPVATMAQARDRPDAITYVKGTAAVRQLAALIGPDTVTRGLADYLTRFAERGSARLDDLIGCWSRASGRDLSGWADAWLRTAGTPRLAAVLTEATDATIASLTVTQDLPRPHRVGVALYDAGQRGRLRHRRTELVELAGTATELPRLAGEPLPAAVFVNAGDWALAQVTIDDRSLAALAEAAFDVGDPLTEAACWNAAWHMVLTGQLAAADYAALVARRLTNGTRGLPGDDPTPAPLTPTAAQALLGRALTCADRYVPRPARTRRASGSRARSPCSPGTESATSPRRCPR